MTLVEFKSLLTLLCSSNYSAHINMTESNCETQLEIDIIHKINPLYVATFNIDLNTSNYDKILNKWNKVVIILATASV